jgi:hypothetical protein
MKSGLLHINFDMLEGLLRLPDGVRIGRVVEDNIREGRLIIKLTGEDNSLSEVKEGDPIPVVKINYTIKYVEKAESHSYIEKAWLSR